MCGDAAGSGSIAETVDLPVGATVTYSISATVDPGARGLLANTASAGVPATITDPVPGNNSDTDTDALLPRADLSITKTDGVTSVVAGSTVSYTITVANSGPSTAFGAHVTDTLPSTLSGATWTCVGSSGGTCTTASGTDSIDTTVDLPVGGVVTFTLTATLSASATGSLVNTATVDAAAGTNDPATGNNSATDTDTVVVSSDLSVTKSDGVTTATPGAAVEYTITVTNAGPSNAIGVRVVDVVPATLTGAEWSCAADAAERL